MNIALESVLGNIWRIS